MKCGVVTFPGSNCDQDCYHVLKSVMGQPTDMIFHKDTFFDDDFDLIVLPGGFSYGDYLRPGAIARFSPVMKSVKKAAKIGKLVLGICNGFQILVEANLLPGALLKNIDLKFHCHDVYIKVMNNDSPFTALYEKDEVVKMNIAHADGNYYADNETFDELERNSQIVFCYCDERGEINENCNPNGSVKNIAGICNVEGNILGLMPHPERCSEEILGSADGKRIFESIITYFERRYACDSRN